MTEHYDEAAEEAAVQAYLRQSGMLAHAGREPGVEEKPEEYVTPSVLPVTTAPTPHPVAPPPAPPTRPAPPPPAPRQESERSDTEPTEDEQFEAYMAQGFPWLKR
jgi:hypothetical protein